MSNDSSDAVETDPLLAQARHYCITAHGDQKRANGSPYWTHPAAVVQLLRDDGCNDVDVLAAAYLHDVLEDTPITREEIAEQFGEKITVLVEQLTNSDFPGRTREQKHAALAEEARRMSPGARWVKLADRLHNLSKMKDKSPEWQHFYANATTDLLDALQPWPSPIIAQRIQQLISPYQESS